MLPLICRMETIDKQDFSVLPLGGFETEYGYSSVPARRAGYGGSEEVSLGKKSASPSCKIDASVTTQDKKMICRLEEKVVAEGCGGPYRVGPHLPW